MQDRSAAFAAVLVIGRKALFILQAEQKTAIARSAVLEKPETGVTDSSFIEGDI